MKTVAFALAACALLASSVHTAPAKSLLHVRRRQQDRLEDRDFLNYILSLDQLQAAFYSEGLDKYEDAAFRDAGYPNRIKSELQTIYTQDSSHADFLTDAINSNEEEYYGSQNRDAVKPCSYDFKFNDVGDFIAQASILEQTVLSAHLGIQQRLSNRTLKSTLSSFTSVQSRHSSLINILNNERNTRSNRTATGDPLPNKIETPLGIRPVISALDKYLKSCPDDAIYEPLNALEVEEPENGGFEYGDFVNVSGFKFNKSDREDEKYQCTFVYGLSQLSSPVTYRQTNEDEEDEEWEARCTIPEVKGYGLLALFVTDEDGFVQLEGGNDNVVAGPAWISIQQEGRGVTV
ncbi:hypothetical protein HK097_009591 [Rhizophlyctis rosea]|uniref:Uncharacterized protein n=1 Tax=Rhizophlyctis rosea TaxID=64517 RepID=A0AAD5S8R5_9FUNG|nr:hypothetical protein HK097_009591 [Rhizophlyctis rosea]